MNNKFTMPLTWHNCQSCPPEEQWNDNLYVSDGKYVFKAEYSKENGWYNKTDCYYLYPELIWLYYWADIEQTVRGCSDFKGE